MRAYIGQRDNWAQIRIGACALLLPPLILGAAFCSMLATPDDGAARPPGAAVKAQVVRPELLRDTTQAPAIGDPQPVAQPTPPIAVAGKPAPEGRISAAEMDGAPTGALAAEPSWPAPAEVSTALLPRPLIPPGKVSPQIPPPRMIAENSGTQAPSAADRPSAEGPSASPSTAHKHTRSEPAAGRRNARSQRQQEFSLKNWLQQLGVLSRNTRG